MARDYAKRNQGSGKRAPARKKPATRKAASSRKPASAWRWYGSGVLTGMFLSFLLYLGTLPSPGEMPRESGAEPGAAEEPPRPRFDFYTLLPEQTIEPEVDPADVAQPRAAATAAGGDLYLLQAGSFRQREDADRRRAELLLLGLEPRVEESNGDNGRWYRVYLGPFTSHSKMSKARSLTAGQDIDTLLLKRTAP
jgi:hypothetical protein